MMSVEAALDSYYVINKTDIQKVFHSTQDVVRYVQHNTIGKNDEMIKQFIFSVNGPYLDISNAHVSDDAAVHVINLIKCFTNKLGQNLSFSEKDNLVTTTLDSLDVRLSHKYWAAAISLLQSHQLLLAFTINPPLIDRLINVIHSPLSEDKQIIVQLTIAHLINLFEKLLEVLQQTGSPVSKLCPVYRFFVSLWPESIVHSEGLVRQKVRHLLHQSVDEIGILVRKSDDNKSFEQLGRAVKSVWTKELAVKLKKLFVSQPEFTLTISATLLKLMGNMILRSDSEVMEASAPIFQKAICTLMTFKGDSLEDLLKVYYNSWKLVVEAVTENSDNIGNPRHTRFLLAPLLKLISHQEENAIARMEIWWKIVLITMSSSPVSKDWSFLLDPFLSNLIGEPCTIEEDGTFKLSRISSTSGCESIFRLLCHVMSQILSRPGSDSLWKRYQDPNISAAPNLNIFSCGAGVFVGLAPHILPVVTRWLCLLHRSNTDPTAPPLPLLANEVHPISLLWTDTLAGCLAVTSHLTETTEADVVMHELVSCFDSLSEQTGFTLRDTLEVVDLFLSRGRIISTSSKHKSPERLLLVVLKAGWTQPPGVEACDSQLGDLAFRACSLPSERQHLDRWARLCCSLIDSLNSRCTNDAPGVDDFLTTIRQPLHILSCRGEATDDSITGNTQLRSALLAGAGLRVWQGLALALTNWIERTHLVGKGDLLHTDLSTCLDLIYWPLLNTPKHLNTKDEASLLDTLDRLYGVFNSEASLLTTVETNSWCADLADRLMNALRGTDEWWQRYNLRLLCAFLKMMASMAEPCDDFDQSRGPFSPTKWIDKRSRPLGPLTSLLSALLMVADHLPIISAPSEPCNTLPVWLTKLEHGPLHQATVAPLSLHHRPRTPTIGVTASPRLRSVAAPTIHVVDGISFLLTKTGEGTRWMGAVEMLAPGITRLLRRCVDCSGERSGNGRRKHVEGFMKELLGRIPVKYQGTYDTACLKRLSPLLCAAFDTSSSTTKLIKAGLHLWNNTFALSPAADQLNCPADLLKAVQTMPRASYNQLSAPPGGSHSNTAFLRDSLVTIDADDDVMPPLASQLSSEPDPTPVTSPHGSVLASLRRQSNGLLGLLSPTSMKKSTTPPRDSSVVRKEEGGGTPYSHNHKTCWSEPKLGARPSIKRRLFIDADSNSNSDYEIIPAQKNPKRRRTLTEHQKEKMAEQRQQYVPPMYNNLDNNSQSNLILSTDTQSQSQLPFPVVALENITIPVQLNSSNCAETGASEEPFRASENVDMVAESFSEIAEDTVPPETDEESVEVVSGDDSEGTQALPLDQELGTLLGDVDAPLEEDKENVEPASDADQVTASVDSTLTLLNHPQSATSSVVMESNKLTTPFATSAFVSRLEDIRPASPVDRIMSLFSASSHPVVPAKAATSSSSFLSTNSAGHTSRGIRMLQLSRKKLEETKKRQQDRSAGGVDLDVSFDSCTSDLVTTGRHVSGRASSLDGGEGGPLGSASSPGDPPNTPAHVDNTKKNVDDSPSGIIRDFFTPKKGHRVSFAVPIIMEESCSTSDTQEVELHNDPGPRLAGPASTPPPPVRRRKPETPSRSAGVITRLHRAVGRKTRVQTDETSQSAGVTPCHLETSAPQEQIIQADSPDDQIIPDTQPNPIDLSTIVKHCKGDELLLLSSENQISPSQDLLAVVTTSEDPVVPDTQLINNSQESYVGTPRIIPETELDEMEETTGDVEVLSQPEIIQSINDDELARSKFDTKATVSMPTIESRSVDICVAEIEAQIPILSLADRKQLMTKLLSILVQMNSCPVDSKS